MNKALTVQVDKNTFPGNELPEGFDKLQSTKSLDVFVALIHSALWTRPPNITGFHLADYWAWLRYSEAFGTSTDLRLRPEWNDVDPHQKTILSDEIGVGATTSLLVTVLGFRRFVDTQYAVRTLAPEKFKLDRTAKRGPTKSPDYIGTDGAGRFVALECKGTQASPAALQTAVKNGVGQKKNLKSGDGTKIHMGLVGGLFIPQANSPDSALVLFRDPTWAGVEELLKQAPVDRLTAVIVQGCLAKQLALAGLALSSAELASNDLTSPKEFSDDAKAELRSLSSRRVVVNTEPLTTHGAFPPAVLTATADVRLVKDLTESAVDEPTLLRLAMRQANVNWRHTEREDGATVITPDGIEFDLALGRGSAGVAGNNGSKRVPDGAIHGR